MSATEGVEGGSCRPVEPKPPTGILFEPDRSLLEELKKRYESHKTEHGPQCYQECLEESKRFAMEYVDACFAKLQEESKRFVMEYFDACVAKPQEKQTRRLNFGTRKSYWGISDESEWYPAYLEEYKRIAMEYMDSCFAYLRQTTHPGVEFELLTVPYTHLREDDDDPEERYAHIHFNAKHQNANPQQRSPELFCAVIHRNGENRVIGCDLLGAEHADGTYDNCIWYKIMPKPIFG